MNLRYDRDSVVSNESWKAALLSSGSIIQAVDKVMAK
jgi:acetoin utilization deacetylase AcuC-like enzyme